MAKSTKKAVKASKTKKATTAKKTSKKVVAKKITKKPVGKKKESTHIIAILDRSGSMKEVAKDAIGGYNAFLTEQKKLKDKATLSGMLFDNQFEPMYDGKILNVKDVPELTSATFIPRGMTALYDAIGKSVNQYKAEILKKKKSEIADKVLVIIVTDGHENGSNEFTQKDISDLITYQKKNSWQFLFLCSTEDAVTIGASLGVAKGNTFQFANTSMGNAELYSKVSFATANYRSMSTLNALRDSDTLLLDENE
jgi:hypothetical protein